MRCLFVVFVFSPTDVAEASSSASSGCVRHAEQFCGGSRFGKDVFRNLFNHFFEGSRMFVVVVLPSSIVTNFIVDASHSSHQFVRRIVNRDKQQVRWGWGSKYVPTYSSITIEMEICKNHRIAATSRLQHPNNVQILPFAVH